MQVEKETKKEVVPVQQPPQPVRNDLEEEDNEESYYRYMEENPNAGLLPVEEDGIELGKICCYQFLCSSKTFNF